MNCYELLNEVKELKKFKSDNELAKFLGVSRQAINGIKKGGGFNDETAKIIATVTKRELSEILLIREIQIVNDPIIKKAWEKISHRAGIAASIVMLCFSTLNNNVQSTDIDLTSYTLYEVSSGHRSRICEEFK